MTRQEDAKAEERSRKRINKLVKALEYGITDALQAEDVELLGLSIKFDAYNCLLTVRAYRGGVRSVCFIGSDSIINAFLKLHSDASRNFLTWKEDQYHSSGN